MIGKSPYTLGYEAGFYGPDISNCPYYVFSSPEKTKQWEQGKKDGEQAKLKTLKNKKV